MSIPLAIFLIILVLFILVFSYIEYKSIKEYNNIPIIKHNNRLTKGFIKINNPRR
jgi:uncharacterized membrane protein YjfL (UPF0719 family)